MQAQGTGWFNRIFGGQSIAVIDAISGFAGVKSSSSNSLISMVTPLIMGLLGKQATENNLDTSGFSGFLNTQKSNILSALPSGLGSLASMLGLGSLGSTARETVDDVQAASTATYNYAEQQAEKSGGGLKWLLPLLLLAALAFLLWWLMGKGCNKGTGTTGADTVATAPLDTAAALVPATTTSGTLDTATGNYIYNVGNNTEIKLADGTILTVGENSTEARLYHMLSDAAFAVDTVNKSANWVVLDRVYFETGKSVLTAESAAQILNIASILKNFPKAAIKLGGYTDNTGDAAINKKVSAERAKIVSQEMVKAGAEAKQIVEAEGYGPEFPVCAANDTDECKAQNRRVDLKVAVK
ncbi:OmpA family protein [Niabella hibiscisoli]|uniref:OmpA family protein n=1 Tax=Niabella hibiscisoli TaxID=1825928 RepID=UPI0021D4653B|nr:OmpA family protein [Niabella hibiscisoli]